MSVTDRISSKSAHPIGTRKPACSDCVNVNCFCRTCMGLSWFARGCGCGYDATATTCLGKITEEERAMSLRPTNTKEARRAQR
jgi:hypothetical protein